MSEKPISPLRRRMIEDMTVRNFVEKTRNDYIRHVRSFTAYRAAAEADAILPAIIVVAFAKVARMGAAAAPIPYMQLASTMSAAQESDQKTLASANRRHRFVPLPVHRIAPYHSLILFVDCPVNISYMMIADEDAALFGGAHRALTFLEPASYQQGRYWTPSPNISPGVEGIA